MTWKKAPSFRGSPVLVVLTFREQHITAGAALTSKRLFPFLPRNGFFYPLRNKLARNDYIESQEKELLIKEVFESLQNGLPWNEKNIHRPRNELPQHEFLSAPLNEFATKRNFSDPSRNKLPRKELFEHGTKRFGTSYTNWI